MIAIPHVLAIFISIILLYYSHLIYKKKIFSFSEFAFWVLIWGGLIFITLYSSFVDPLFSQITIYRLLDIIVVISILVLFGVLIRLHKKVNESERINKELVRTITYLQENLRQK